MKLVVLSDLHGNYPALQAVVDQEGLHETYAVLGDIHGLLAQPKATVELVQELDGPVLAGNHEKAIFHKQEGHVHDEALRQFEHNHTINNLSREEKEWVRDLPYFQIIEQDGERICLTHSMPWPEEASGYEQGNGGVRKRDTVTIASVVADDYDWVLHGHTHQQYALDCEQFGHDVQFVNPGTLGYNGAYAVVDTATGSVSLKCVDYDLAQVKAHIRDRLPHSAPDPNEWL